MVLHEAVLAATLAAAAQALWDHLGARADDPESWYRRRDHGIMVQYFQHPAFEAIRRSARIHKAFAQLWGHADLWATTDRVGFNAPERPGFMFPGPDLHWDCSVKTPIPFGTQGIVYLTDTPPEQGAFTLVPGFQRWGEDWLKGLPPGADRAGRTCTPSAPFPLAGAPATSSSGTRRCRTAPAPTGGRSRGWCSTSPCFRRGWISRKSGFEGRAHRRGAAASGR